MADEKGRIVILQKSGEDSNTSYALTSSGCIFGRDNNCHMRILKPTVSLQHCILNIGEEDKVYLTPLPSKNPTVVNGKVIYGPYHIKHKDIITVVERSFRFEYPQNCIHYVPDILTSPVAQTQKMSQQQFISLKEYVDMTSKQKSAAMQIPSGIHITSPTKKDLLHETKAYLQTSRGTPNRILKKKVSFGPSLSPEQFDKTMPPSTPIKRGSLPTSTRRAMTKNSSFSVSRNKISEMKTKNMVRKMSLSQHKMFSKSNQNYLNSNQHNNSSENLMQNSPNINTTIVNKSCNKNLHTISPRMPSFEDTPSLPYSLCAEIQNTSPRRSARFSSEQQHNDKNNMVLDDEVFCEIIDNDVSNEQSKKMQANIIYDSGRAKPVQSKNKDIITTQQDSLAPNLTTSINSEEVTVSFDKGRTSVQVSIVSATKENDVNFLSPRRSERFSGDNKSKTNKACTNSENNSDEKKKTI